ncbi:MAG: biotin--[acetyl-CoA-carboxylase] ligase [Candidatus Hydrogenedentota bacterium]
METSNTWHLDMPARPTERVGRWVAYYPEAASTQTLAANCRMDGAVFVADAQTGGRGTHGRSWHSAPGRGLWCSVVIEGSPHGLTAAAALAIRDAARPKARLEIAWPNDLLLNGRKVAGVLVEHKAGWNALGIGVNVHHAPGDFPKDLRPVATSLAAETSETWDRGELLAEILFALDSAVAQLYGGKANAVMERWRRALDVVGHTVRQGAVVGRVTGIDADGALVLATSGGVQRLYSGPIAFMDGERPCSL